MSEDPLQNVRYEGGDGSTKEEAIRICGADTTMLGVAAEHAYVQEHFPQTQFLEQRYIRDGDQHFDVLYYDTGDHLKE